MAKLLEVKETVWNKTLLIAIGSPFWHWMLCYGTSERMTVLLLTKIRDDIVICIIYQDLIVITSNHSYIVRCVG